MNKGLIALDKIFKLHCFITNDEEEMKLLEIVREEFKAKLEENKDLKVKLKWCQELLDEQGKSFLTNEPCSK